MIESFFFCVFVFIYKNEPWKTIKKSENLGMFFFSIFGKSKIYNPDAELLQKKN